MRKLSLLLLISFLLFSCQKEQEDIPSLSYQELKPILNKEDNKTYIINFWATWCAPCVKELPYFEKMNKEYADKNVEVILVSLDFPDKKEKKLLPFVDKNNIQSKVLLLDDPNEQFWIGDISDKWSGALPATLIFNKNKREFYEKSFDYNELESAVKPFIE